MPALVANAQMACPVATPTAVASPAARPPSRGVRMGTAGAGAGGTIPRTEMTRKARKASKGRLRYSIAPSRIDQNAGIHHALGIELALGAAQGTGEQLGPLLVVERPVEAADGMMMRGRAALLNGGRRAGRQHLHELIERDALVQHAAEGEVEAGAVGIDVGEPAGDGAVAPRGAFDGVLGEPDDLLMEVAHALPGHRGLEGRGENAARHRVLAVVRRTDEAVAPGAGRARAMRILVV